MAIAMMTSSLCLLSFLGKTIAFHLAELLRRAEPARPQIVQLFSFNFVPLLPFVDKSRTLAVSSPSAGRTAGYTHTEIYSYESE